jgi:hypothetical protein
MAEALMTEVTEREAAAMYARACRAWYGRRALRVIKETIKQLRAKNDESGVRIWTLVAEALPDTRAQHPVAGRPQMFEWTPWSAGRRDRKATCGASSPFGFDSGKE